LGTKYLQNLSKKQKVTKKKQKNDKIFIDL
jgi:hypothetical protein